MVAVVSQVPLACVEATEHHFRGDTALATSSSHPQGARSAGGFDRATRKVPCLCWLWFQNAVYFCRKPRKKCIRYLMPVQSNWFQP